MKLHLAALLSVALLSLVAPAQRDAPVWECYLASTVITHGKDSVLNLDLLFKKEGGPYEHTEHQMYLIAYFEGDESEVLKVASDKTLLDKKKPDAKLFLDVLLEKRLATVLETKVAKKRGHGAQDVRGKYRDGSGADEGKAGLERNGFAFRFGVKHQALFDAASKLKNFDATDVVKSDAKYFNDRLKFLVFVPVNDCKYATQVAEDLRTTNDFAHFDTVTQGAHYRTTPKLFCKPLSFSLQFKQLEDGRFLVYIN